MDALDCRGDYELKKYWRESIIKSREPEYI